MILPARYQYDPRWQILIMSWALVAAFAIVSLVLGGDVPRPLGSALDALAVFSILLALLITLRRYGFPRYLGLDEKGIWLPSGFLRMTVRRVVFAEISELWEVFLPRTVVLCFRSRDKTYEVTSTLLRDHETYLEVAGYIYSRVASSDE